MKKKTKREKIWAIQFGELAFGSVEMLWGWVFQVEIFNKKFNILCK